MFDSEIRPIKDWIKTVPTAFFNYINKGSTQEADYFFTFVQKQGRMLSIMSSPRILILILWKDRTHSLGYIESIKSLPPWNVLPYRKYEKDLALIVNIDREDNMLEFKFKDEEEPWKIEFKNRNLAGQWRTFVKKYMDSRLSIDTTSFQIHNLMKKQSSYESEKQESQNVLNLRQSIGYYHQDAHQGQEFEKEVILSSRQQIQSHQDVVPLISKHSEELSEMPCEERRAYIYSQQLKIQTERQRWKNKQIKFIQEINDLKSNIQRLQKGKQEQEKSIKALMEKFDQLMLEKIIGDKIKDQYLNRYRDMSVDLAMQQRENEQIRHICSRLYQERRQDKQQIKRLKEQSPNEQKVSNQTSDEFNFLDILCRTYKIVPVQEQKEIEQ